MIQLKYSSSLENYNTSAIFSDGKVTTDSVIIELSSSFSGPEGDITASVISNTADRLGGWLLLATSQSVAPTASGFYDATIYEGNLPIPDLYTGSWIETYQKWNEMNPEWDGNIGRAYWRNTKTIWNETTASWVDIDSERLRKGTEITQERVFVSGSDYDEEYKYEQEELAYYNVYDG